MDVSKSTGDGAQAPHYAVYCAYEDGNFDWNYTEDLSVESLEKVLREVAEAE